MQIAHSNNAANRKGDLNSKELGGTSGGVVAVRGKHTIGNKGTKVEG